MARQFKVGRHYVASQTGEVIWVEKQVRTDLFSVDMIHPDSRVERGMIFEPHFISVFEEVKYLPRHAVGAFMGEGHTIKRRGHTYEVLEDGRIVHMHGKHRCNNGLPAFDYCTVVAPPREEEAA